MEDYNVKKVVFSDGQVDTRIYKKVIKCKELSEDEKLERFLNLCTPHELTKEQIEDNKRRSVNRARQQIYEICKNEKWDWFVTLTLSPEKVDRFNYVECSKKVSQWLKNLKKKSSELKYIIVPEKHPKKGGYHFHGLFANISDLTITDSGHKKCGQIIYNLDNYSFGWSTVTIVRENEAVVRYLTKYITKDLVESTKGKKKYWVSRNVQRPIYIYEENTQKENCFLWQYLMDNSIEASESISRYNDVMYFRTDNHESAFLS